MLFSDPVLKKTNDILDDVPFLPYFELFVTRAVCLFGLAKLILFEVFFNNGFTLEICIERKVLGYGG